jgi:hypothetical protein
MEFLMVTRELVFFTFSTTKAIAVELDPEIMLAF